MNERGTPERSGSSRVLETPDQIRDSFVDQSLKWDPLQKASGAFAHPAPAINMRDRARSGTMKSRTVIQTWTARQCTITLYEAVRQQMHSEVEYAAPRDLFVGQEG
jgi:hypothetical protein